MNRLVIIGNGFDLAHRLKTGYNDFFLDYLRSCIKSISGKISYSDRLINMSNGRNYIFPLEKIESIKTINDFNQLMTDCRLKITRRSSLYDEIISSVTNLNWVDIELAYFALLRKNVSSPNQIKALNEDLDFLKKKLESYLKSLSKKHARRKDLFVNAFTDKIRKKDIVLESLDSDLDVENIHFLNFNYTDTIYDYVEEVKSKVKNVDVNFIHGELGNHKNPIVFGFGDEMDESYLNFEKVNNNELYNHIKSFAYSKTNNYQDLVRFLESGKYQVCLFGHSCGLSDRTMLNHIFEHDHCISIKIYYHQINEKENDFTEKTHQIYRHFKDKGMMRLKIVTEENSFPHPKGVMLK